MYLQSFTLLYLLSSLSFLLLSNPTPQQVSVEIITAVAGGEVYLAVYNCAEGFEKEQDVLNAHQVMAKEAFHTELDLQFPAAGAYVVAAFQDLNGNGKLDRNFLGVPTEPYGFGQLPPSKWRAPTFSEVVSRISGDSHVVIEMRHWKDY